MGWIPIIALLGCIVCFGLLFTFNLLIVVIQLIIVLCGVVVFYAMKSKIETRTSRFIQKIDADN